MAARLRIVCAWCHRVMQMGGLPTSHGICAQCEARATAHLHPGRVVVAPSPSLDSRLGGGRLRELSSNTRAVRPPPGHHRPGRRLA